jgi:hypothetical protein
LALSKREKKLSLLMETISVADSWLPFSGRALELHLGFLEAT